MANLEFTFKFFKDCLPQILLGPLLNTLSHITEAYLEPCQTSQTDCKYSYWLLAQ